MNLEAGDEFEVIMNGVAVRGIVRRVTPQVVFGTRLDDGTSWQLTDDFLKSGQVSKVTNLSYMELFL